MTEDLSKREDEDLVPDAPADEVEAAEEAEAALEDELYEDEAFLDEEAMQAAAQEAMSEAQARGLLARAEWSLVHKELLLLLFANCLFFVGVLAAWSRAAPGVAGDPSTWLHGLDTIRGSAIFVLAIFGFWMLALNFRYRQSVVWPFLLNAILALWVGIPGFTRTIGSERWDTAVAFVDDMAKKSFLDKVFIPLSSVPPAYWLLTFGGAIVLIVLLKGVMSGASAAKQSAAAGGRRRRR